MAQTLARHSGPRRRTMNEINMVPFIDVMLVLLIIFMVSAPLITASVVDLPSVGKAKARQQTVVELVVGSDEKLQIKTGNTLAPIALAQLTARVREAQQGDAQTPVVISAERNVKYEAVVKVMDTLQRAGVQRVGLSVKQVP
jgi:biopolymer transport protein TolR